MGEMISPGSSACLKKLLENLLPEGTLDSFSDGWRVKHNGLLYFVEGNTLVVLSRGANSLPRLVPRDEASKKKNGEKGDDETSEEGKEELEEGEGEYKNKLVVKFGDDGRPISVSIWSSCKVDVEGEIQEIWSINEWIGLSGINVSDTGHDMGFTFISLNDLLRLLPKGRRLSNTVAVLETVNLVDWLEIVLARYLVMSTFLFNRLRVETTQFLIHSVLYKDEILEILEKRKEESRKGETLYDVMGSLIEADVIDSVTLFHKRTLENLKMDDRYYEVLIGLLVFSKELIKSLTDGGNNERVISILKLVWLRLWDKEGLYESADLFIHNPDKKSYDGLLQVLDDAEALVRQDEGRSETT